MAYNIRYYWVFGDCTSSGTLKCCLEHRTMGKVQKLSNPKPLFFFSLALQPPLGLGLCFSVS
jgi:hypothetical protein